MINLEDKTPKELRKLMDSVKVSDLSYEEKTAYINAIEQKLNGADYKNKMLLKEIEEGQADISDLGN